MDELHIQPALLSTMRDCLGPIRDTIRIITCDCPRCGTPVRYPLIASAEDAEAFQTMMRVAEGVLERHGVTALLLSEIRAACYIEIAKRKSKGVDHE